MKALNRPAMERLASAVFFLFLGCAVLGAADVNVAKMTKELKSSSPKVRARAANDLGRSGKKEAVSAMLASLESEKDPAVRTQIAGALGARGNGDAVNSLIQRARKDSSQDVRVASCMSLGMIGDKAAVSALKEIALSEGEDDNVRISAAGALAFYLKEAGVTESIASLLKQANRVVRLGTVNGLRAQRRNAACRALLKIAAQDADEDIRELGSDLLKG